MGDNWSRNWRKLVEWDNENKVYIYKWHKIYPLSYKEQIEKPMHLQNEYYWGEISHIEKIVREEEKSSTGNGQAELQEALNIFFESVGL